MYFVLGSGGMLGSEICRLLDEQGETYRTATLYEYDTWIYQPGYIKGLGVDTIINCAGAITGKDPLDMIRMNAQIPVLLRQVYSGKIVYISTDCVFSGREFTRKHRVFDLPDPDSLYGMTKRIGEMTCSPTDLVIRTSFIGNRHGLLRWVLDAEESIEGWLGALWNGSTVDVVAEAILKAVNENREGTVHIANPIAYTKYDVIRLIRDEYALADLHVTPVYEPRINRALQPTLPIEINLGDALHAYHLRTRDNSRNTSGSLRD